MRASLSVQIGQKNQPVRPRRRIGDFLINQFINMDVLLFCLKRLDSGYAGVDPVDGITDVLAGSKGSSNPHNVVKATFKALQEISYNFV